MKKRSILCAVMLGAVLAASGCAADQISNEYVTIAKYKGVEVPKVEGVPEITDESVENNINIVLEGFSKTEEITDRPAEEGDLIILDYTAKADGQAVEDENSKDYQLTIGGNSFYEGFDENLVGHKAGDTISLTHTFDKDYSNTALAGKDVVLEVQIKSVNEKKVPDFTDEFVKTISQKSDTVDEYREEMKEILEENNETYIKSELTETAWEAVLKNAEIEKYPEDELKEEKQTLYDHYQEGAKIYDMEFADFLAQMDMTEEDFEKKATEAAKSNVKENVVVKLIAEKEDISLSDKEYKKEKKALAEEMGYDSVKDMEEEAPEEYIKKYILRDKVKDWVADNCIQVESKE